MAASPQYRVDVDDVRKHYDQLSSLYRVFWGEHLHHGYWDKQQSAARAQVRLMERLAEIAEVPRDAVILDIGCGLGGSALWLAEKFGADVTGLTISPVQKRMATKKAKTRGLSDRVRFELTDANEWQPEPESVDLVWIMESSEHFRDKKGFFERCATALKPGGTLAVAAWLRRDGPIREDEKELVATIGSAMMSASLEGLSTYRRWMEEAGLTVTTAEDITRFIEPTWTHCARMVGRAPVKWLVRFTSTATRSFVNSFPLMRQAYAQGAMAFGLFAARKAQD